MKGIIFQTEDASTINIGIIVSRWNSDITQGLLEGCKRALQESQVKPEHVDIIKVPGSFELPFAAKMLIEQNTYDAIICLGCLIKGETMHFEYLAQAVSYGIMKLNVETQTPVVFGVLTCLTEDQSKARSTGENNHGYGWGKTAVEMALLRSTH